MDGYYLFGGEKDTGWEKNQKKGKRDGRKKKTCNLTAVWSLKYAREKGNTVGGGRTAGGLGAW